MILMNNKKIPLSEPNITGNELKYVTEAIRSTWISTKGMFVDKFEDKIAKYVHSKYAIACQNGTAGLHIALILAGVKPFDEVIVPTLTFIAPINVVKYVGAEPVFMDCDKYMNMDIEKTIEFIKKECKMTKNGLQNKRSRKIIKTIIPVHIFGSACNMVELMNIARKYNLKIIEDSTESLGTYYTEGKYKNKFTGTTGDIGVFSFNGNKIITAGAGGMVVTDSKRLALEAKYLTTQAKDDSLRYIHNEIGYNYRMTNLQAAFGIAQLEKIEDFIYNKTKNFKLYKKHLNSVKGLKLLDFPDNIRSNSWFYTLLVEKKEFGMDKNTLMYKLNQKGIQSRPLWYLCHWQKPYKKNQSYKIEKAVRFWKIGLNIPCSSYLKKEDVLKVIKTIGRIKEKNNF